MTETLTTPIRIVVVDGSELVRRGVRSVLQNDPETGIRVVGEAGTTAAAVAACQQHKPDIVLLDIRLTDGSGFDACRQILEARPGTRVVVLTSYSNDEYVFEAVRAGAQGYLMKEIDPAGLIQAIKNVAAGRSILDPEITTRVLSLLRSGRGTKDSNDLSLLSPQERRVLKLVADGLTNKQVGEQLTLSENTVKNYLINVFKKLKVKRRAQAAAIYVQHTKTLQS